MTAPEWFAESLRLLCLAESAARAARDALAVLPELARQAAVPSVVLATVANGQAGPSGQDLAKAQLAAHEHQRVTSIRNLMATVQRLAALGLQFTPDAPQGEPPDGPKLVL